MTFAVASTDQTKPKAAKQNINNGIIEFVVGTFIKTFDNKRAAIL
jgi:hypothetical protein